MDKFQLGSFENDLINQIYQAALDPKLWKGILQKIRDLAKMDECTLFFYDAQCRSRNYAAAATMDEIFVEKFLQEYIDHEAEVINQNFQHIPVGTIVMPPQMEAITEKKYEEIIGTEYMEELRPKQQLRAGAALIHGKFISSAMGLHSLGVSPAIPENVIDFLDKIVSHMSHAMNIHNHITSIQQTNQSLQETLKRINIGVFLLDKNLRVSYSNPEAIRILESSNTLCLGRGGRLYLVDNTENTQLQSSISELAELGLKPENALNQGVHLAAKQSEISHPLKLSLIPIYRHKFVGANDEDISIAVLVNDPSRPCIIPEAYLQQAYGMTNTEQTLIKLLVNNLSVNDIAATRGTSVETTRWQLKAIMQKTNTHSQAELSRLLMTLSVDLNKC